MNVVKAPPVSCAGCALALGDRPLVLKLDFAPAHGSSSVVIGQTGVGKSVFLKTIAGVLPARTFRLGGSLQVHGIDAYVNGRKTGLEAWSRIMRRGLVFVPAESAQAMNPALTLDHNLKLLAPESRAAIERRLTTYFGLEFGAFARLYPA